jgi:LEA14-like dessication related protein
MRARPKHKLSYILLLTVALLQACATVSPSFEPPKVNITSLEMLEPQGLSQRFKIGLVVTNPNAKDLPLTGMSYSLSLNGYDLINGASNKLPALTAYSETPITIEAATDLFAALRFLNALANQPQDALNYEFSAKLDLGGWRPPITVKRDGLIELR